MYFFCHEVCEHSECDVQEFGLPFCEEEWVLSRVHDVLYSLVADFAQPFSDLLQVGPFDVSQPAIPSPTFLFWRTRFRT